MKIVNEKGKLFGIINLIDLLIVLMLVGVVIAGFFAVSSGTFSGGERTDVYFTVEFLGVEDWFGEKIEPGDRVSDSVRGFYLGEVVDKEILPREINAWNAVEERIQRVEVPGEFTVLMTVKANGTVSDSEILAEGQPIKVGKEMFIKGKGYAHEGYIVSIETAERSVR